MIIHAIETADRECIEEQQLKGLRTTLSHVFKNIPFYREAWEGRGLHPSMIQDFSDLKKLPFTEKKDLRNHYPFGMMAAEKKDLLRIHASSGTTGKPTIIGYTSKDIESWAEIVSRAIAAAGGSPNDILHNAYGYGLFTGGLGIHHGSEKLGIAVIPASAGNTERQITLIEDLKPDILCATPSYALNIAEKMLEIGKNPRHTSLKYGILGAEPWSEEMRNKIENILDIKACDIYGLSEVIGPGVAIECHEAQDGMHIAEDHFYVEVIDPITMENVADGVDGELVFTSLQKEAFPIIRYRTGDIASITREACKCGRTTMRMSRVKGRIDDMLIIRGVNVYPSEIEHCLMQFKQAAPHYQLVIEQNGSRQDVILYAEITEDTYLEMKGNLNCTAAEDLTEAIQLRLKNYCLVNMEVKILSPKTIPRSEGKAVRIVDLRNKELISQPIQK
ncbi:phenylacetate--CoA ligase [Bacillus sp. MUM 13]|uniref:phenylacetate--CoA ligase family protein n=1 Tax=Bacillus sp. MUM 13 TaxID=1678001 RepID=UPI0008F5BF98|nr:phenylacetate--CoA ligase [Bacillus sp. MUM 13]OIK14934.1 phenylacetate--CoA ligase [Bacillus sp. MUM 13]